MGPPSVTRRKPAVPRAVTAAPQDEFLSACSRPDLHLPAVPKFHRFAFHRLKAPLAVPPRYHLHEHRLSRAPSWNERLVKGSPSPQRPFPRQPVRVGPCCSRAPTGFPPGMMMETFPARTHALLLAVAAFARSSGRWQACLGTLGRRPRLLPRWWWWSCRLFPGQPATKQVQ